MLTVVMLLPWSHPQFPRFLPEVQEVAGAWACSVCGCEALVPLEETAQDSRQVDRLACSRCGAHRLLSCDRGQSL